MLCFSIDVLVGFFVDECFDVFVLWVVIVVIGVLSVDLGLVYFNVSFCDLFVFDGLW